MICYLQYINLLQSFVAGDLVSQGCSSLKADIFEMLPKLFSYQLGHIVIVVHKYKRSFQFSVDMAASVYECL